MQRKIFRCTYSAGLLPPLARYFVTGAAAVVRPSFHHFRRWFTPGPYGPRLAMHHLRFFDQPYRMNRHAQATSVAGTERFGWPPNLTANGNLAVPVFHPHGVDFSGGALRYSDRLLGAACHE